MPSSRSFQSFPFEVKELSRSEKIDGFPEQEITAERLVEVPWEHRIQFTNEMYGHTYPDNSSMYLLDFEIQGAGPIGKDQHGDAAYQYAQITCQYRSFVAQGSLGKAPTDPKAPRVTITDVELDFGMDAVEMPDGAFVFPDGHEASDAQKRIGTTVIRLVIDGIPSDFDKQTLASVEGSINAQKLFGFPVGHVLLDGVRMVRKASPLNPFGDVSRDFTYQASAEFVARTEHWNHLPHPKTGQFELVTSRQGGNKLYEEKNIVAWIEKYVSVEGI